MKKNKPNVMPPQETTFSLSKRLLTLAFLSLTYIFACGQATIVVTKLPQNTPATDSLYIVGNFNDWEPGDKHFVLGRRRDGTHAITMPANLTNIEFKITRGSWPSVEGDVNGKKIDNRKINTQKGTATVHAIEILSWEDLGNDHTWNISVKKIPDNTPYEAPIYISGSFNNWRENDPDFKLTRLSDNNYAIKIPKANHDTIWYKFNRGSWAAVESRENGRTKLNRISVWQQGQTSSSVTCTIDAWDDIGGGSNLVYTFILTATAFQSLLIILSLLAIRRRNKESSGILIALMLVTLIALIARLATYNRFVFNWQPKLLLLSDFIYVAYAPLLYSLIKKVTGITSKNKIIKSSFIGAALLLFAFYIPPLALSREQFVLNSIDGQFNNLFKWTCGLALIYNASIWFVSLRQLIGQRSIDKSFGFANTYSYAVTVLAHSGLCLVVWAFALVLFQFAPLFHYDPTSLHESTIDALWIIFALSTYTHTFLVIRKPELFKLRDETEDKKVSSHQKENIESLKAALTGMMKKQKPYLNAKLTLQDLADMMKTNGHTLSWLINEGYDKNFFDFINEYRIEEFKRLVGLEQYKDYTFLAISMEVGFSSKTTFNRAFKKSTGKTPREYFNHVQESQLEGIGE